MGFAEKITGSIRNILIAGLVIRLLISPFFADSNDFPYWTSIALDVRAGSGIYADYGLWYPPVWGYVIALVSPLLDILGCAPIMELCDQIPGTNNLINEGWLTSIGAVVIIKLPLILADIANGYLIYRIASRFTDERRSLRAAALWTFCPLTIWVSAGQGQFETLCLMFVLIGVLAYLKGSYILCGIALATATLTKISPSLVILPMLALIWVRASSKQERTRNVSKFVGGGVCMSLFIILPQIIFGELQFVMSFLTVRLLGHNPLPAGFEATAMAIDPIRFITPSGTNVSVFASLAFFVCIILTVFIFVKKRFSDRQAVLIVTASLCTLLMWFPAPGYTQYYVTIVGMLALCSVFDSRYEKISWAVAALALICMFASFTHAYPLIEWNIVDTESLRSFYSTVKDVMFYPEIAATTLKFVPILIAFFLAVKASGGENDG